MLGCDSLIILYWDGISLNTGTIEMVLMLVLSLVVLRDNGRTDDGTVRKHLRFHFVLQQHQKASPLQHSESLLMICLSTSALIF